MSTTRTGPILIIEDDRHIAALVERYLSAAGFDTTVAHDGRVGLEQALSRHPLLIILDIMLPHLDGWEICRELRKRSDTPIVFLTAREEETDRVVGLSLGADDYVVKPFSPRELVERVKAILRRTASRPAPGPVLRCGDLTLETEKHKVAVHGEAVCLTPSEYKILLALMSSPGRVFTREELLAHLYRQAEAVVDRVVDVHVGKLRQKIEPDPARPRYVLTVRGTGYRLAEDVP